MLPEGWKTYKLSELLSIIGGGTPKTEIREYWNGTIPWLSVVDFNKGRKYVYDTDKTITETGLQESATKILKKGQIIISARGTVGELAVLGKDMAFNQSCYGLDANENTGNDFLFYLVKSSIAQLKKKTHGAVFDTITKQTFENIEVTIPEQIEEQSRIASILSSLDDKIELNLQMNKTLEAIAQAIFEEWFVEFRFPGFDGELVDGLPKGWRKGTIKEIYKTTSGGTPSRSNDAFFIDGSIKWVKSKELNGSFIIDTEEQITEDALNNSSAKTLPKNSLLIAMYGATVGEFGILSTEASCNQAICAIIPNERYPFTYILGYYRLFRNRFINQASGSAQQNISQALIQNNEVIIPKTEIAIRYHEIVSELYAKTENNLYQNLYLQKIRDLLLPKLMTGKIKVW